MDRAITAAAPRGPTKHPPRRSDHHGHDPPPPTPTDSLDSLPRPSPPSPCLTQVARLYPAATLEADRSARPRRQRLGGRGLDRCDRLGTSLVHITFVRCVELGFSPQQESYAANFFIGRLQSGFVAAPPSGSCVKNRVSTAVEDNSNKRKKRSTASLTPKIRRPPLYRSPPPPVHRPYALPSRAHQQPYAPRSEVISYDSRTPIERGNHPSLAILRRRSDQQACSTSLPTPPLSYFPTQSYA
ncbi:hypothetical protein NBRC10513_007835 [Rhodotorula toruloides]|uniref:Uncharacterized protein n=1 Tax=Rhodotorula toruloides TaxID=5286 RepID=A0A0K3CBN9_RHOTO